MRTDRSGPGRRAGSTAKPLAGVRVRIPASSPLALRDRWLPVPLPVLLVVVTAVHCVLLWAALQLPGGLRLWSLLFLSSLLPWVSVLGWTGLYVAPLYMLVEVLPHLVWFLLAFSFYPALNWFPAVVVVIVSVLPDGLLLFSREIVTGALRSPPSVPFDPFTTGILGASIDHGSTPEQRSLARPVLWLVDRFQPLLRISLGSQTLGWWLLFFRLRLWEALVYPWRRIPPAPPLRYGHLGAVLAYWILTPQAYLWVVAADLLFGGEFRSRLRTRLFRLRLWQSSLVARGRRLWQWIFRRSRRLPERRTLSRVAVRLS